MDRDRGMGGGVGVRHMRGRSSGCWRRRKQKRGSWGAGEGEAVKTRQEDDEKKSHGQQTTEYQIGLKECHQRETKNKGTFQSKLYGFQDCYLLRMDSIFNTR